MHADARRSGRSRWRHRGCRTRRCPWDAACVQAGAWASALRGQGPAWARCRWQRRLGGRLDAAPAGTGAPDRRRTGPGSATAASRRPAPSGNRSVRSSRGRSAANPPAGAACGAPGPRSGFAGRARRCAGCRGRRGQHWGRAGFGGWERSDAPGADCSAGTYHEIRISGKFFWRGDTAWSPLPAEEIVITRRGWEVARRVSARAPHTQTRGVVVVAEFKDFEICGRYLFNPGLITPGRPDRGAQRSLAKTDRC